MNDPITSIATAIVYCCQPIQICITWCTFNDFFSQKLDLFLWLHGQVQFCEQKKGIQIYELKRRKTICHIENVACHKNPKHATFQPKGTYMRATGSLALLCLNSCKIDLLGFLAGNLKVNVLKTARSHHIMNSGKSRHALGTLWRRSLFRHVW